MRTLIPMIVLLTAAPCAALGDVRIDMPLPTWIGGNPGPNNIYIEVRPKGVVMVNGRASDTAHFIRLVTRQNRKFHDEAGLSVFGCYDANAHDFEIVTRRLRDNGFERFFLGSPGKDSTCIATR